MRRSISTKKSSRIQKSNLVLHESDMGKEKWIELRANENHVVYDEDNEIQDTHASDKVLKKIKPRLITKEEFAQEHYKINQSFLDPNKEQRPVRLSKKSFMRNQSLFVANNDSGPLKMDESDREPVGESVVITKTGNKTTRLPENMPIKKK